MKKLKLFITTSMMMLSVCALAQPQQRPSRFDQGERPARPTQKTPAEIAKKQADMMKAEVNLTDKQYKKVYNLIKQDQEYRKKQIENQFADRMPQGGPGGGFGGDFGGGMPQGGPGGPGGFGGGMPQGRPDGDFRNGQRPEGIPEKMKPGEDIVTDEYLEKQEKKLQKILTKEQYTKWRSKHPAEHHQLPPVEMQPFEK